MLTLDDIQDRIPHRFENLLLTMYHSEPNVSEFTIDLQTEMHWAEIFSYNMAGSFVVPTPLLLNCSLGLHCKCWKNTGWDICLFCAITQFPRSSSPFKASHTIHGSTKISDKNLFSNISFP